MGKPRPQTQGLGYGGLAVTDNGSIYLLHEGNEPEGARLLRFSPTGEFESTTSLAEAGATYSDPLLRGATLGEDHVSCVYSTFIENEGSASERHSHGINLLRVGADGQRTWQRDLSDRDCVDIARDEDGNLLVAGNPRDGSPGAYVQKLDPNGETLWELAFDEPISSLDVHENGHFSVAGMREQREVWVATFAP